MYIANTHTHTLTHITCSLLSPSTPTLSVTMRWGQVTHCARTCGRSALKVPLHPPITSSSSSESCTPPLPFRDSGGRESRRVRGSERGREGGKREREKREMAYCLRFSMKRRHIDLQLALFSSQQVSTSAQGNNEDARIHAPVLTDEPPATVKACCGGVGTPCCCCCICCMLCCCGGFCCAACSCCCIICGCTCCTPIGIVGICAGCW